MNSSRIFICVMVGMILGVCVLGMALKGRVSTYRHFVLAGQEAVQTFLNAQEIPDPNGCGKPIVLTVDGVVGKDTSAAWSLYRTNEYYRKEFE